MRTISPAKIHNVATAIAKADGCEYSDVSPAVRQAYNEMAAAAIRASGNADYMRGYDTGMRRLGRAKVAVDMIADEMEAKYSATSGTFAEWVQRLRDAFQEPET